MLKKVLIIILISMLTLVYLSNTIYAVDNVMSSAEGFLGAANSTSPIDEKELSNTSNYIYNILFTIAVVLAVAIGMVIGIQFMLGSAEEQAKVKETLVPYVIGVFIVFASFTIWKIVVGIGNDVAPTPESQEVTQTTYIRTYYTPSLDKIKCNNCQLTCYVGTNETRSECPHCHYKFTEVHTTKTKIDDYNYRCDLCQKTYNPRNYRTEKCPNCDTLF